MATTIEQNEMKTTNYKHFRFWMSNDFALHICERNERRKKTSKTLEKRKKMEQKFFHLKWECKAVLCFGDRLISKDSSKF